MPNAVNVVIYSGGMDSYTVLHLALRTSVDFNEDLVAVSFNYGQRHKKELDYAKKVTTSLGIEHEVIDLSALTPLLRGSALTSPEIAVPEGHYEAENMKATVVPGRNTLMLSIAMAYAESLTMTRGFSHGNVWYGAHSGDHHIYPDCRPDFVYAMMDTFREATGGAIGLTVPFLHGNKRTILEWGNRHSLNYAHTWTCYKGVDVPCGVCGSCQERAEAFAQIGRTDPLLF